MRQNRHDKLCVCRKITIINCGAVSTYKKLRDGGLRTGDWRLPSFAKAP